MKDSSIALRPIGVEPRHADYSRPDKTAMHVAAMDKAAMADGIDEQKNPSEPNDAETFSKFLEIERFRREGLQSADPSSPSQTDDNPVQNTLGYVDLNDVIAARNMEDSSEGTDSGSGDPKTASEDGMTLSPISLSTIKADLPSEEIHTDLTEVVPLIEQTELTTAHPSEVKPDIIPAAIGNQILVSQNKSPNAPRDTDKNLKEADVKAAASEAELVGQIDLSGEMIETQIEDIELLDQHQDNRALLSRLSQDNAGTPPLGTSLSQSPQSNLAQPLLGLSAMSPDISLVQTVTPINIAAQTTPPPNIMTAVTNTVAEVLVQTKETTKGIVVQLDPPEMGRVYVDFIFEQDNAVSVVIRAESAESQMILRERQDFFHHLLSENGFGEVDIQFDNQTGQQNDNSFEDESSFEAKVLRDSDLALIVSQNNPAPQNFQSGIHNTQIDIRL
jgi:flagellar hook-length control protein FliK